MDVPPSWAVIQICALLILLLLHAGNVSASEKQCISCHETLRALKTVKHVPMGSGCLTCHDVSEGLEHPQQKDSIRLKEDVPRLCYSCHPEGNYQDSHIHQPVLSGKCVSCHNPHHSENEYLLVKNVPEICFECHDKENFKRKYEHTVSSKGCVRRCHNVHASSFPYLLHDAALDICLTCHASQATGRHVLSVLSGGKVHPVRGVIDPSNPTKEISCVSCHDPHSSNYPKLAPSRRLCSRCHKSY